MCQQWFGVIGLVLDVIGFFIIAFEWFRSYQHQHDKRIAELEEAHQRFHGKEPDEDANNSHLFQRLFLDDWKRRGRIFATGAALVILGFLGQAIGSLPSSVAASIGITSCQ